MACSLLACLLREFVPRSISYPWLFPRSSWHFYTVVQTMSSVERCRAWNKLASNLLALCPRAAPGNCAHLLACLEPLRVLEHILKQKLLQALWQRHRWVGGVGLAQHRHADDTYNQQYRRGGAGKKQ